MGSTVISRNDWRLIGQDLLSMNTECWHFFFSYKQEDLHSDSLGPLMHTQTHTRLTFKFVVKFVSLFCCLRWTPLLSLWCLNNGLKSQDSLPVPYIHQFSLLPGKKIVCYLLRLFLLKLSFKHRSSWQQHVFSMCLMQKSEGFGGSFVFENFMLFINHDCAN